MRRSHGAVTMPTTVIITPQTAAKTMAVCNTLADVLVVVCAVILRYDDRSAGTQAGEETDDEVQYL